MPVVPLTERILGRLPGRRWAWMVAWAAPLPLLVLVGAHPSALEDVWDLAGRGDWRGAASRMWSAIVPLGPALLACAYAVPHALWAVEWTARRAVEASPAIASVQLDRRDPAAVTPGIGAVGGPAGLAIALAALATAAAVSYRGAAYLAAFPALALGLLPQATLLWVYLSLMLGLFRLGSHALALEQYSGDRTLGLRPVGRLAFAGFWSFVANFAPLGLLALGGRSVVDLAVVSVFLVAGTLAIFGSLLRVRGQMKKAKRAQTERARALYAEAYAPLRSSASLEVLQRQAPLLAASDALEKRAESIQTWPFGDALLARAVVIATSVLAAVITRLAQRLVGM